MRFIFASLGLSLALATPAFAESFASVAGLDAASRTHLQASIAAARTREPAVFDTVASIIAHADELDHKKRGRFYPMTPLFRGSMRGHPTASMALLEPIVSPERFAMPRVESARIALRAGLIEAAGDTKDPAAAPVYRAIVSSGTEFFEVRAAAEALGKLGLDVDVAMLGRLANTPGPNQDAVLDGFGSCRRVAAAHALEAVAAHHPVGTTARHLLMALGTMGSAWALATPNAAPPQEIPGIRDTAARAALAMFVGTTDSEVRAQASDALMIIAAP